MPGYILTGTPGAGKTAILRQLELGFELVEVAPGPLPARVAAVYRAISTGQSARRSRREPTDPSSRPS
jgi:predicted ATPase